MKPSSTGLLYDVWVTGIGSFKITDESTVEVGKLIDPTQQHLFIDSLEHNLKQLKKGTCTQVYLSHLQIQSDFYFWCLSNYHDNTRAFDVAGNNSFLVVAQ